MACTMAACACPKEFRGVHDGDTLETTIGSVATDVLGSGASCGALGDLVAGAILVTRASVGTDQSGGSGCFSTLSLTPLSLTTGSFEDAPDGTRLLRLADNCAGHFIVYFQSDSPTASFLDNSGSPPWWLIRTFEATANSTQCFPDGVFRETCMDAFTGYNTRK